MQTQAKRKRKKCKRKKNANSQSANAEKRKQPKRKRKKCENCKTKTKPKKQTINPEAHKKHMERKHTWNAKRNYTANAYGTQPQAELTTQLKRNRKRNANPERKQHANAM